MYRQKIRYTASDSALLFITALPSAFRCDGILLSVIFILLTAALSVASFLAFDRVFKDTEKTSWKILLPFCLLSIAGNVLGFAASFPFTAAALCTVFSKKMILLKKAAAKSENETGLHPQFTFFAAALASFAVVYAATGVMI